MSDNSQSISAIGVYDNHSLRKRSSFRTLRALNSCVEGRNIYLELAAVNPRNATVQNGLAVADLNVGNMLAKTGHPTEGLALMDQECRQTRN